VDIIARQPIGCSQHDAINSRRANFIAQAVQPGTVQCRPALPIISEDICESGVEIRYEESTIYRRQQRNVSMAVFVDPLFSIPEIFNS
jgi:hypoxanthine-guanine phosphoribosyltransferase